MMHRNEKYTCGLVASAPFSRIRLQYLRRNKNLDSECGSRKKIMVTCDDVAMFFQGDTYRRPNLSSRISKAIQGTVLATNAAAYQRSNLSHPLLKNRFLGQFQENEEAEYSVYE